jgi:hypothetical protein
MSKKYIIFFSLLLLAALFTGCAQKPMVNNQITQNQQIVTTTIKTIDTSDWQTYRNKKYEFEIKYPKEGEIKTYPTIQVEESPSIAIYINNVQKVFIDVYNPQSTSANKDLAQEVRKIKNMELKEYVVYLWNLNKNDESQSKSISELKKIELGGFTAYQFSITGGFKSESGSILLREKTNFTYLMNKGKKFIIESEDDNTSDKIVSFFKFLK